MYKPKPSHVHHLVHHSHGTNVNLSNTANVVTIIVGLIAIASAIGIFSFIRGLSNRVRDKKAVQSNDPPFKGSISRGRVRKEFRRSHEDE